MNSGLPTGAGRRLGTAALVAAACLGALAGCAQQGAMQTAMMGQSTTLCAGQAAPAGWVVVAKQRDFDCGTNAYDSWEWIDLRGAAPGRMEMVCVDPTMTQGLLPPGWEATAHTDSSARCGPWGANARVQVRYSP